MILLLTLAWVFTQLSLLAFGGGNAILPEMQHQVVEVYHWLSADQFSHMFAMAQAAPGPNMMIVPLIGWHVAGLSGLIVTSVAKFGPSSMITAYVLKLWQRHQQHPWRNTFEKALKPITVSLVLVSVWLIAQSSTQNLSLISIVILTGLWAILKKIHPLWLMAIGALLGIILL